MPLTITTSCGEIHITSSPSRKRLDFEHFFAFCMVLFYPCQGATPNRLNLKNLIEPVKRDRIRMAFMPATRTWEERR